MNIKELKDKGLIVDECDEHLLLSRTWSLNGKGYVIHNPFRKPATFLHHLILSPELGKQTDHVNRNKLDNRRLNLRNVTPSQNNQNQSVRSDNLVGYKGVSYVLGRGKYRVTIRVNKKRINVGRFDNPHDAARAYNKAATLYHGEFAVLNEIV